MEKVFVDQALNQRRRKHTRLHPFVVGVLSEHVVAHQLVVHVDLGEQKPRYQNSKQVDRMPERTGQGEETKGQIHPELELQSLYDSVLQVEAVVEYLSEKKENAGKDEERSDQLVSISQEEGSLFVGVHWKDGIRKGRRAQQALSESQSRHQYAQHFDLLQVLGRVGLASGNPGLFLVGMTQKADSGREFQYHGFDFVEKRSFQSGGLVDQQNKEGQGETRD